MSDTEEAQDEKQFAIERAKQGRAGCKKCKQKCNASELRLAKIVPNPFGEGKMKNWFHVDCLFEQFLKQRPTTKRIESSDDIDGWDSISDEDRDLIEKKIEEYNKLISEKYNIKISPKAAKPKVKKSPNTNSENHNVNKKDKILPTLVSGGDVDYLFREFRKLVADITNVSSYIDKTNIVKKMFTEGPNGEGFKGDITLWCRLLLPGVIKRIYNLQSKILVKIFSKIFEVDSESMLEHLEQGDIGETIQHFFEQSNGVKPTKKSNIAIGEVDSFLEELSKLTKQDEQTYHLKKMTAKCTSNDLKIIIRLIKHDLRMNAGAKHILDGVHPDAYQAYQSCRDIKVVISRCLGGSNQVSKKTTGSVKATISLMTPVLPMLAEACKSVEQAMKKCPNGMYSEIKYDGERVQVHKQGSDFKYFSRSLKPVMPHKVSYFKEYIPKAFPHGKDLILDCEILMVDTNTGKPLPFGTLGVHKKSAFQDASVCLFVFDCIYYNGDILTHKPIQYRKQVLEENMTEIPNHVMFSEMKEIHQPEDLSAMIAKVLKLGLEGLVLKDLLSIYEPGKRHWLKVKKDYLFEGAMADTADLIVLGAWYGTGKKGGMMSIFLMGCYDNFRQKFCTVTKVHTGHDDKTLERLQSELDMVKISGDTSKVPSWLKCTKTMIPDFVANDPKKQPIWEITGAEFTQIHDVHTADGISIRFPRVTRIRNDKNWETATNLEELRQLFKNSKENTDVSLLMKGNSINVKVKDLDDSSSSSSSKNIKKIKKEKDLNIKEELDDSYESIDTDLSDSFKNITPKRKINDDCGPNSKKPKLEKNKYSHLESSLENAFDDSFENNVSDTPSSSKQNTPKRNRFENDTVITKRIKLENENFSNDTDEESPVKEKIDESGSSIKKRKKTYCQSEVIIKNPLPDYFTDIKLLVENGVKDTYSKWLRYFIAYGGIILHKEDSSSCNYVLHARDYVRKPNVKCPPTARHITIDWIKDSIYNKELQDCRPYAVKIMPKM